MKPSPVSILKPLKGADQGLRDNLISFFLLDYPEYEVIFSVAQADDPACAVVRELIDQHARRRSWTDSHLAYRQLPFRNVSVRLIVGDVDAGPNPKINNLIRSYAAARHDLVLISDSNIRVDAQYLNRCVALLTPEVGIVTAAVTGQAPRGFGGRLEEIYLNTFYARWMAAANHFGYPTVLGKSMLFRKSTAERFGGIQNLSRYLAEDYVAGKAMHHLGLATQVMAEPLAQIIGHHSFESFWQRHVRWGRMRKNMLILPWIGELFSGPVGAAAVLALGLKLLTGSVSLSVMALHFALWFACDLLLMLRLRTRMSAAVPFYWLARELFFVPMWMHILCGNTVLWRGSRLRLEAGGVLTEAVSERKTEGVA